MKKYLYLLGSAVACVFVMAACSNGGGSSNATTCTANAAGCVYSSQYGWLQQSGCQIGQGMYNNQCVMINGGGIYGQQGYYGQGYYPQQQSGLYQTPYYNYPVSTYPYGYGYSNYGYGYNGGCRVGSALGGFINYYTCGY